MDKEKQEITDTHENKNEISNMSSYFKEENDALDSAITEINELYDEVKEHYNAVKNASRSANGGRGVLSFVEKQTANLVTLKNSKASLIQSKITLKKVALELAMKQKKETNESQVNNEIVDAILRKLDEKDNNSIIVDDINEDLCDSNKSEEDLLEDRLKNLIEEGEIKDTYTASEVDGILAIKIKGKKWKFIGLSESGSIIKNFPVPDKKDYKIKVKRDSEGKKFALDQNGRMYKVIEIE